MCLLIVAHRVAPDYPLLVAGNRDEFHSRATAPAAFWPDHPMLLAGRDLVQGGTWMGITRSGRFAALTNYRDPARTEPAPRSRGEVPLNYLTGQCNAPDFLQGLAAVANDYAGFNLLLAEQGELWYFSNAPGKLDCKPRRLPPGIYGLSNDQLDTPWPKVAKGKTVMQAQLDTLPPTHDALGRAVADRSPASASELKALRLHGSMEPLLSAQFIVNERYGTRSTTTLWTDNTGRAHWREHSYDEHGQLRETREECFSLAAADRGM